MLVVEIHESLPFLPEGRKPMEQALSVGVLTQYSLVNVASPELIALHAQCSDDLFPCPIVGVGGCFGVLGCLFLCHMDIKLVNEISSSSCNCCLHQFALNSRIRKWISFLSKSYFQMNCFVLGPARSAVWQEL